MRNTRRTRTEGPTGSVRGPGRLAVLAAAGLAAAALVAGCGSSASSGGSPPASPPASSSAPAVPGTATATLRTTNDARLGTVVADSAGFTLYRFDNDSATPPTATCTGDCATLWPPAAAPADGTTATVNGLDAKLVGTVTRADGSKQLTLAGWPLYRYAPDHNPGDTKGQGVQGVWFAVTPTGDRAATTSGGSGY
ncbi:COG4315 family predicted lipoprotein [Kitasatospora purpeofusca]|uniref:COG4315 family predicted lipoprotein n=1 Tax=Kitasatospora purpeofusca TaxID=67352 RepID=UPI003814997B